MTNKTLFVIGNEQTVTFFRLLGANGLVIDQPDNLIQAHTYIEQNSETIGGILLDSNLTTKANKALDKIISLGIPLITLPDAQQTVSSTQRLEALMEKAVGMKLNKGD